jgi:hypothetical protein
MPNFGESEACRDDTDAEFCGQFGREAGSGVGYERYTLHGSSARERGGMLA